MSTSTNPIILSEDSLNFKATDLFSQQSSNEIFVDNVIPQIKNHDVEELSLHLPTINEDVKERSSPFNIHSSVLDSVFSSSMNDASNMTEEAPMLDEMEITIDGVKVNQGDDWVSLFGAGFEQNHEESMGTMREQESLNASEDNIKCENRKKCGEFEGTSVYSLPKQQNNSFFDKQNQLFSPNISSTLSTPNLDAQKLLEDLSKKSNISDKKIDYLGCVPYSKKRRNQPLPPIQSDPSDPIMMKRARNTAAARRSRARKMERMCQLENKVEELMNEKNDLKAEIIRLRELLIANGIQPH